MNIPGTKKSHRERKNPRAAEQHQARRHAANAARPKQIVVDDDRIGKVMHVRLGEAT